MCRFRPVILEAFSIRINNNGYEVLNISNFGFFPEAYFLEGVKCTTSNLCSGIEFQDFAIHLIFSVASGQVPQFAFHIMNNNRMRPSKQSRNNQAHALPASSGCNRGNMLWPIMAQIM